MGGKLRFCASVLLVSSLMATFTSYSNVAYADKGCIDDGPIGIVYVRGSGEGYNDRYFRLIEPALVKNLSNDQFELHELKTDLLHGENDEYRASAVLGNFDENYAGTAALLSSGDFGKYKASVMSGVSLLKKYLTQISEKPNECIVLLGYSQGAQVIGDTLTEVAQTYPGLLDRVIYVGLFGDPKLDLRGEGMSFGKNIPWYRGNALPIMSGGSLGSRLPYVPVLNGQYLGPVGSWCYDDDFICTENYMAVPTISAHGKYPERSFGQMSLEVANAVKASLTREVPMAANNPSCRPGGQDVVVLLDTSPVMRRDITLFANSPMSDPFHTTPQGLKLPPRTAGQMITESGCNDTRVAVVGYGRPSDGPPRVLLGFTSKAKEYDDLMKSLYEQTVSGIHERTQFREGALLATGLDWRPTASRTIYAITNSVGSGPEWAAGTSNADQIKRLTYRRDRLTQEVIESARAHGAVIIGHGTRSSYHGFTWDVQNAPNDQRNYLDMFAAATGGYNWVREWPSYSGYSYKLTRLAATLEESYERHNGVFATALVPRMKVGESMKLQLSDTASDLLSARSRGEGLIYKWYVDCNDKGRAELTVVPELLLKPDQAAACEGSVVVETRQAKGNGCYVGCPEPFPPKYTASLPLKIDIRPADYVPLIPGPIRNLQKFIYENHIAYEWAQPEYAGAGKPVYVVRDDDGFVLALTTGTQLTITDTHDEDPAVHISALGEDGKSDAVASRDASIVDMRIDESIVELPLIEHGYYARIGQEPNPAKPTVEPDLIAVEEKRISEAPVGLEPPITQQLASSRVIQRTTEAFSMSDSETAPSPEVLASSDSQRPEMSNVASTVAIGEEKDRGWVKPMFVMLTTILTSIFFPLLIRKHTSR